MPGVHTALDKVARDGWFTKSSSLSSKHAVLLQTSNPSDIHRTELAADRYRANDVSIWMTAVGSIASRMSEWEGITDSHERLLRKDEFIPRLASLASSKK